MRITALIENRAQGTLLSEHGLAVHIEYNGKQYLLDTGASEQFLQNAERLGIDLAQVDAAFLSHNHNDHSGGFAGFFAKNGKAKVYLQSKAKERCCTDTEYEGEYIGIPEGVLDTFCDRFVFVDGDKRVFDGVWLVSHKTEGLAERGKRAHLFRETEKGIVPDDFAHEQSLVFEAETGLVILNSCCHAGVDTVIREVKDAFPGREVLAVIGGFHLMGIDGPDSMADEPEELRLLAQRLISLGVKELYTGHCTGGPAYEVLKRELGEKLHYFSTGTTVEW